MLYFLVFPSGHCEEFSILECALVFQAAWSGEVWSVDVASAIRAGELTA